MKLILAAVLALGLTSAPLQAGPAESTQANMHFNLALKLYQAQKLDDAKATLAKALSLVPDHPQANLLSGIIAAQQGRFQDAIAPLKIAAKNMPNDVNVYNNLGVAYFQLGKTDDAEEAFNKVLALKPGRADVAQNLGILTLRKKKYPAAMGYFSKATAADATNSRAWLGLAEAADGAGDKAAGLLARQKALALQPQDKALRLDVAERLYQAERITEAAETVQELKGQGDPMAEFLLGILSYRQGSFDASRDRFQAALSSKPDYNEARYNLAITYYDQGYYEDAMKQFQLMLDKHPGDEEVRKNQEITRQAAVRSYLKTGSQDFLKADYSSALKRWRAALALDAGNKVVKDLVDTAEAQMKLQAEELAAQGQKDWDAGKKEEAISGWAQALDRDANNASARKGLEGAKDEVQKMSEAFRKGAEEDLSSGRWAMARAQAAKVSSLDKAAGKKLSDKIEAEAHKRFKESSSAADAAAKKGSYGALVDAMERAVDAQPLDDAAQLRLNQARVAFRQALNEALEGGAAAEKAGKSSEAVKQYRRVIDLQATNPTAKEALKRLGAKATAKGVDPAQLEDMYYQGVYAYAAGQSEKAEALWKKVLEMDPKHVLAKEALDRSKRSRAASKS